MACPNHLKTTNSGPKTNFLCIAHHAPPQPTYKWEDMAVILQEETRLTSGENEPFRWTQLKGMTDDSVIKALPDDNMGIIVVVSFSEMGQLREISNNLLQVARVDRLDLLIITEDNKALFPNAGPKIEKAVPWHINDLHKLNRPV